MRSEVNLVTKKHIDEHLTDLNIKVETKGVMIDEDRFRSDWTDFTVVEFTSPAEWSVILDVFMEVLFCCFISF